MIVKSVLVLCTGLLAFVAAGGTMEPRHAYRSGHEYSYDLNGQLASSMSNGEQYSASRFRALIKLNFISDTTVIARIENSQLGQWNDYLENPHEIQRFDNFESVEIKSDHLEKIQLPFQFRFINGKITDITFHKDDITFTENSKRAIINALQVQLENPSETNEERNLETYGFALNETTIEGDCESIYAVRKVKAESQSVDSYNVTKSIDFSRCQYRPELRYNYFRYAEPVEFNPRSKSMDEKMAQRRINSDPALDISSVYEFAIIGDRRQFIVKESMAMSRYSYEMMDTERARLVTYAIAKMTLKNVERKEASDSVDSSKPSTSLVYSDNLDVLKEKFIADGDETYLRQNPYMPLTNAPTVVNHIMKRLLEASTKDTVEGIDEHATRYLTQLVSILRLCSRTDIKQIHDDLFKGNDFTKEQRLFMQHILADSLAIAGTKNTIDHLISKIRNGDITHSKAASALLKLMNLQLVSADTVRNLFDLCQDSRFEQVTIVKRTCMLTYGAMVNAMCKLESPFQHSDKYTRNILGKYCDSTTKNDITKDITNYYKRASSRADKVLALKTIGNMGLETTVTFLEQIIRDWNIEKLIRIQAIDALRQMRSEIPRKIQRVLLPVFQDRREHPEIRMNAIYQLLHTRPEKALLDIVMTEMIREPNMNVKTFVNQLVYQMAENAKNVYDRETAQALRSMLKSFRMYFDNDEKTTMFTSKFWSTVISVDHRQVQDLASQLNFAAIFSNDSRLPKEVMASLDLLTNNRLIPNTYQVGMHSQDLEQLLERLWTVMEDKNLDDMVSRGRRSLTSEYNPVTLLKGFFKKMKIATRRATSETVSPIVLLYSRWLDMDTLFCLTDEESLPQIMKSFFVDGQIDISTFESKNTKFNWAFASYGYEQQIKTPTITGQALITTIRIPTIAVIDGSISTAFPGDDKEDSRVRGLRVHLKAEPKFATTVIVKMEVFSPIATSGIKTFHSAQIRLPLNLIGKVHAPHWNPELEVHMPREEIRLLHLQSRPVTFYRVWPLQSTVFVEAVEKTLIVEQSTNLLKERRSSHVDPFLGMNINLDAHWHSTPLLGNEKVLGNWLISGENSLELKIQPTADSCKVMKLSFGMDVKKNSETRYIQVPDFETLFGSHTDQIFAEAEKDELQLIKNQMKHASGQLNQYRRFHLKAEALKGARPHVAKMDLTSLCDDRMILCVLHQNIDLDSEWTSKSVIELAMHELRGVVGVPSRHVIAKVSTDFGSSSDNNQLRLSLYGRPSAEKIESLKRWMNIRTSERIASNAEDFFERTPQSLKANDFIMITESRLTPELSKDMESLYSYINLIPFVAIPDQEALRRETSQSSSTLMTRLILNDNDYNLTLSTPSRGRYQYSSDRQSFSNSLVDVLRSSHGNDAQCIIRRGRMVETFDGKKMKLPMTTCYTVVAKDCVEKPRFAMMVKKMDKYDDELKLKMVTETKVYEMYRENKKMVVKVDGYLHPEADYEQYGIFKVGNQDDGLWEIRCSSTGASARFDGVNVMVRLSTEYLHRQCGICGHYNNDVSDDLRKHDNGEAQNLRDFHSSYLYRDQECDAEAIKAVNRDSSEEGADEEYSEDVSNMMESSENKNTVPITVLRETSSRLCFSTSPIQQCPHDMENVNPEKTEVEFSCMSRSSPTGRRLQRKLDSTNTIEIPEEDIDEVMKRHVQIPQACAPKSFHRRSSNYY